MTIYLVTKLKLDCKSFPWYYFAVLSQMVIDCPLFYATSMNLHHSMHEITHEFIVKVK